LTFQRRCWHALLSVPQCSTSTCRAALSRCSRLALFAHLYSRYQA
jgi:hypothetical protein